MPEERKNPGTPPGGHASSGDMYAAITEDQAFSRSFDDFYRNHRETLIRVLSLTLGNVDLATDATDEAMARTFQRWNTVAQYRNPEGWAYRVGLNWARSWLRKRRREVGGLYVDEPATDPVGSDPTLVQALAGLPIEYRAVVVLRYYADWSLDDIALALQIPKGTVKSRLSRGLTRLNVHMEERR